VKGASGLGQETRFQATVTKDRRQKRLKDPRQVERTNQNDAKRGGPDEIPQQSIAGAAGGCLDLAEHWQAPYQVIYVAPLFSFRGRDVKNFMRTFANF
jgi:hypothetical protein